MNNPPVSHTRTGRGTEVDGCGFSSHSSNCHVLPPPSGGGYLRLTVGGREVPTYVIRRLSDDNWGFVMESCWSVFANFDVTKRPPQRKRRSVSPNSEQTSRADGAREQGRVDDAASAVVSSSSTPSDESQIRSSSTRSTAASSSSGKLSMSPWQEKDFNRWDTVTTEKQWKEARLYNNGASVLPEIGVHRDRDEQRGLCVERQ